MSTESICPFLSWNNKFEALRGQFEILIFKYAITIGILKRIWITKIPTIEPTNNSVFTNRIVSINFAHIINFIPAEACSVCFCLDNFSIDLKLQR